MLWRSALAALGRNGGLRRSLLGTRLADSAAPRRRLCDKAKQTPKEEPSKPPAAPSHEVRLPRSTNPGMQKESRYGFISWRSVIVSLTTGSILVAALWYVRRMKDAELERERKRQIGKSLIGGPWALTNAATGKAETQADYQGKWCLIYFGFTHCPDICPDELNKMIKVYKLTKEDGGEILPLFFTVDPERDTAAAVKKYCAEFHPELRGFVGTKQEVEKVARTFRVYHSAGPRDEFNDYIVDHTVIMYLVAPDGAFVDYYGQNRTAEEIAQAIQMQMMKFGPSKGWFA